ncbi:MAG: MBL fold metallo-hydrolase [Chloroflexi bacterium]|nr:MBL fold metallo-hydrolase [Chloroflexota bacterium]
MEVIGVGTCGTYPGAGRACQGWLVSEQGANVLLDCGPGVASFVQQYLTLDKLSAIVISHLHVDHFLDLLTLCYAMRFGPAPRPHPALLIPQGSLEQLETLIRPFTSQPDEFFHAGFDIHEYQTGERVSVGPLDLTFAPTAHYIPCWATSVSAGGAKMLYSADTSPTPELARLGQNADLFICEASLDRIEDDDPQHRGHSTAAEAAQMARDAAARRLVLTHIVPHHDAAAYVRAAQTIFPGPVQAAREGDRFRVGD